jgi:hypothetical protein
VRWPCAWHGSGRSSRPVEFGEGAGAVAGQLLERALVQVSQQSGNRPIELAQAEEGLVAQPGQNPALHHLHRTSTLGFS